MTPAARAFWKQAIEEAQGPPIDTVGTSEKTRRRPVETKPRGVRRYRLARGVTVDSGAHDNVMPRKMIRGKGNRVRPSAASRAGVHYVAASDHRIPNEGETDFKFKSREGHKLSWVFQVAEVNKVLASVAALVDSRHRVTFDKDDKTGEDVSFILNKETGETIRMRRDRNVWILDAFVEEDVDGNDIDPVFARHE